MPTPLTFLTELFWSLDSVGTHIPGLFALIFISTSSILYIIEEHLFFYTEVVIFAAMFNISLSRYTALEMAEIEFKIRYPEASSPSIHCLLRCWRLNPHTSSIPVPFVSLAERTVVISFSKPTPTISCDENTSTIFRTNCAKRILTNDYTVTFFHAYW